MSMSLSLSTSWERGGEGPSLSLCLRSGAPGGELLADHHPAPPPPPPSPPDHFLTESGLVGHVQTIAKAKAEKAQLYRVESCSSDTIRNAIKILQDRQVLVPAQNGDGSTPHTQSLEVANSNLLVDIIKQLTLLRS
ncbi:hypothetical protein GBAR_LOCUS3411 [Geodia barretti]|uniref:Uncharacterized protein n=1 Tax=Geodia barretti TaxID=519541 RepID=A0AA35W196_GEOBA|nr:hypothetical protein GBAR_LOCUS3411 [Geodia barretti]